MVNNPSMPVDKLLERPALSEANATGWQLANSRGAKLQLLGHFLLKVRSMRAAQRRRDRDGRAENSRGSLQWEKAVDTELAILLDNPGLFDVSAGVLRLDDRSVEEGWPPLSGWPTD